MKKSILLTTGIIIGAFAVGLIGKTQMPGMMLKERHSPYSHARTVAQIEQAVTNGGWVISSTMNIQKSLSRHGKTVRPVTVLKICQPDYAEQILLDDSAIYVSVMMPCSIAIYEKSDGQTYVSTMNAGLMGRLFGGTVAEVMGGSVARETAAFTAFLDEN